MPLSGIIFLMNTVLQAYETPFGQALDCHSVKELQVDTNRASATGVFAAASKDRGGDVIDIAGIHVENHRKAPIVLWLHGFDFKQSEGAMPIGVTEDPQGRYTVKLLPDEGIAVATTYFSDKTLLASQIAALVMEKTIRGQSIGYRELMVERIIENDVYVGTHLLEIEMIETSWVPIGMNQDAVSSYGEVARSALSRDWCGKSLHPCIKAALSPYASAAPIWANGFTIATKGKKTMRRKDDSDDTSDEDGGDDNTMALEKHGSKACRKAYRKLRQAHKACKDAAAGLDDDSDTADVINDAGDAVDASANAIREHHGKKYKEEDPLDEGDPNEEVKDDVDDEALRRAQKDDDEELDDGDKALFFTLRRQMAHLEHHERVASGGY
jgi:hypothetical protein